MSGSIARASCPRIGAPSPPFCPAAPPHWEVNSTGAAAAGSTMPITRAITGPVPSAVTPMPPSGSIANDANYCPCPTTWSPSPCRLSCARSSAPTRRTSTRCCCGKAPAPCATSPATTKISAPRLASWPCSRPGRATCVIIPTSIAWCPAAASPPTAGAGSVPNARATSSPNPCWRCASAPGSGRLCGSSTRNSTSKSPRAAWALDWVADVQPVGTGEPALKYLSAYVYRTALSAERILADDGQTITFAYRDNQGRPGTVRLSPQGFLHRFLQHVLPRGFQRIRHFGFLSAAATAQWQRVLALLDWKPLPRVLPSPRPPPLCPACQQPLALIGRLARAPPR